MEEEEVPRRLGLPEARDVGPVRLPPVRVNAQAGRWAAPGACRQEEWMRRGASTQGNARIEGDSETEIRKRRFGSGESETEMRKRRCGNGDAETEILKRRF